MQQFFACTCANDPSLFEDVGTVCQLKCLACILFDQKYGYALFIHLFDDFENIFHNEWEPAPVRVHRA